MAACLRWACGVQASTNRVLLTPVKSIVRNVLSTSSLNLHQDTAAEVKQEHLSELDLIPGQEKEKPLKPLILPKRKERSPLSVLEILASTTKKDDLSPGIYIDDPHLFPIGHFQQVKFSLAKISGKAAARRVIQNYPECFNLGLAEPHISAYRAAKNKIRYKKKSVAALKERIQKRRVEEAIEMYKALVNDGVAVNEKVKLKLFELCCAFNSKDPETQDPDLMMVQPIIDNQVKKDQQQSSVPSSITWQSDGFAQKMFNDFPEKTSRIYSSLIRGMCKFGDTDSAFHLYTHTRGQNIQLPREVYHDIMRSYFERRKARETPLIGYSSKVIVVGLLASMLKEGIKVNVETFELAIAACADKKVAVLLAREMQVCGLEPSLTVWKEMLRMNRVKTTGNEAADKSAFLVILEHIEKQEHIPVYDKLKDSAFFTSAIAYVRNDWKLASRLHAIYHRVNQVVFPDLVQKELYFKGLFMAALSTKKLPIIMDAVDKFTVHFVLYKNSIDSVMDIIHSENDIKAMKRIWPAILLTRSFSVKSLNKLLHMMLHENREEDDYALFVNYTQAILAVHKLKMKTSSSVVNAEHMGWIIEVQLQGNEYDEAWNTYTLLDNEIDRFPKFPRSESLEKLFTACIDKKQYSRAAHCLDFMQKFNAVNVDSLQVKLEKHRDKNASI